MERRARRGTLNAISKNARASSPAARRDWHNDLRVLAREGFRCFRWYPGPWNAAKHSLKSLPGRGRALSAPVTDSAALAAFADGGARLWFLACADQLPGTTRFVPHTIEGLDDNLIEVILAQCARALSHTIRALRLRAEKKTATGGACRHIFRCAAVTAMAQRHVLRVKGGRRQYDQIRSRALAPRIRVLSISFRRGRPMTLSGSMDQRHGFGEQIRAVRAQTSACRRRCFQAVIAGRSSICTSQRADHSCRWRTSLQLISQN